MSKVHRRGAAKPEMNLTPMIDVTFQLIIFFLLVSNIAQDQLVEMRVPKLDNPRTIEIGEIPKLIISIIPEKATREPGADPLLVPPGAKAIKVGSTDFELGDYDGITEALIDAKEKNPDIEIVLRADSGAYFDVVAPVMQAVTAAKISKLNLTAFLPGEAPD